MFSDRFSSITNASNECTATEATAEAQQEYDTESVDGNERGEREQVWNRMAAVHRIPILNAAVCLESAVEAEDPDTANYDPHKEKRTQEALTKVPTMLTILLPLILAAFILA